MRQQSLIALGVALVLGLIAVFLANSYLLASERQQEARGTSRVAVAAVPLGYGVEITRDKIRFAEFPNSSIPPGSFRTIDQLLPNGRKRVVLTDISVNEPILSGKITGAGENASIAALLPDGMRAASVRINDVSGVAGFVQPNDSVDVLVTRQATSGQGNSQQITDMLIQNVRVIAIGQDAKGAEGKPMVAKSATLEVDPLGAQKLALAQEVGSLSLVLRKPGMEQDSPFVETVSLGDLRSGIYGSARFQRPRANYPATRAASPLQRVVRRATPAPRAATPPPPSGSNVEVVRGVQGNNYEVGNYGS